MIDKNRHATIMLLIKVHFKFTVGSVVKLSWVNFKHNTKV